MQNASEEHHTNTHRASRWWKKGEYCWKEAWQTSLFVEALLCFVFFPRGCFSDSLHSTLNTSVGLLVRRRDLKSFWPAATYSKFLIYQRKFHANGVKQRDSQNSCLPRYILFCFVLWTSSSFSKSYLASHGQLVILTKSYVKNTSKEMSTSSCQIY